LMNQGKIEQIGSPEEIYRNIKVGKTPISSLSLQEVYT